MAEMLEGVLDSNKPAPGTFTDGKPSVDAGANAAAAGDANAEAKAAAAGAFTEAKPSIDAG